MTDPRLKEAFERLEPLLDCGDNSCPYKKTNGMRTNGGCRCFKDINPHRKMRELERLIRVVKKIVEEGKTNGSTI